MISIPQGLRLSYLQACLDTKTASTRKQCPVCKKSRALYCYDCVVSLLDPEMQPRVHLPFSVSIVTHSREQVRAAERSVCLFTCVSCFNCTHLDQITNIVLSRCHVQSSKNTGVHAALLAPDQVQLHRCEKIGVNFNRKCVCAYYAELLCASLPLLSPSAFNLTSLAFSFLKTQLGRLPAFRCLSVCRAVPKVSAAAS